MAQLKQRTLINLLYGANLDLTAHFQSFTKSTFAYEERSYHFLDVDVNMSNRRQTQYTSIPQRIVLRTNPESSQEGVRVPGVTVTEEDLELVKILQSMKKYDGFRDSIIEVIRLFVSDADKTVSRRLGVYQVVSSKIKDGVITLVLSSDVTPISPMVSEIRRTS